MLVDASRMGRSIKVDDIQKTVFSDTDEETIVAAIADRENHQQHCNQRQVHIKADTGR